MRITTPLLTGGLAVALAPFSWSAPGLPAPGDLRAGAAAYEAVLDDAWLGHAPTTGLSPDEQRGVARVARLLASLRASGVRVVSATSAFRDERLSGVTYRALVVHTFVYRSVDGDTTSTEAIPTSYRFDEVAGTAVLVTVTERADAGA